MSAKEHCELAANVREVRHGKQSVCTTQMFHLIRASVLRIQREAQAIANTSEADLGRILASYLVDALLVGSPMDVAVVLGSAAELEMYPDEVLFDWSMKVLSEERLPVLSGVYWVVRHRCSRLSTQAKRFSMLDDGVEPKGACIRRRTSTTFALASNPRA